jgi:hypothetical protein
LVFRTAFQEPDAQLEHALSEAFPAGELLRTQPMSASEAIEYQVRFPVPTTLSETRECLGRMRRGLGVLLARFDPERFASLARVMDTFGARETLASLRIHESPLQVVRVPAPFAGSYVVH